MESGSDKKFADCNGKCDGSAGERYCNNKCRPGCEKECEADKEAANAFLEFLTYVGYCILGIVGVGVIICCCCGGKSIYDQYKNSGDQYYDSEQKIELVDRKKRKFSHI